MILRINRCLGYWPVSKSLFGVLTLGDSRYVSCETEWRDNQRNVSCVPNGFYALEPHNGTKYKATYALIGETVAHTRTKGFARFACVLHGATKGDQLKGCISFGTHAELSPSRAELANHRTSEIIGILDETPGPHYLIIEGGEYAGLGS